MAGHQGFEVDSQTVRAHSGTVDGVADEVDQCRRAAASVQLGRDAYGRLCQLIPSLIDPIQQATIDTLNGATDALQRAADDLRFTAREYESGDQAVATRFTRGAEQ
ncbi:MULTISPECIES: type VII secretion target [unclassified Micromonospora]|uniref:type VII secretion target n=1 Tax=unclassified Micromonospora TaxID=2617518 RepID=UPI002FF04AE6